jgi:hypothetical protein
VSFGICCPVQPSHAKCALKLIIASVTAVQVSVRQETWPHNGRCSRRSHTLHVKRLKISPSLPCQAQLLRRDEAEPYIPSLFLF